MAAYEIPLTPEAQFFSIDLNGTTYQISVYWNVPSNTWMLTLADASGNNLISNIPLVANTDLLQQFAYLGIGGKLIVQTDFAINTPPTFDNLGVFGHVYFVTA